MNKTDAVDYLIRVINEGSKNSSAQLAAVETLSEAAGNDAIDRLISFATMRAVEVTLY